MEILQVAFETVHRRAVMRCSRIRSFLLKCCFTMAANINIDNLRVYSRIESIMRCSSRYHQVFVVSYKSPMSLSYPKIAEKPHLTASVNITPSLMSSDVILKFQTLDHGVDPRIAFRSEGACAFTATLA